MATTTATMNVRQKVLPLNWEYWDRAPVPLSLQIPKTPQPIWYQNQTRIPSKRFSIPRHPLPARQSSPSLSEIKPALKKEKMRPENLPPLMIPRRDSSHKAMLLQLQVVSVPGAVTAGKTQDQSQKRQSQRPPYQQPQQLPYRNYQHERVYQPLLTLRKVEETSSSQRVASAECPVIKPVPIPIPPAGPSIPNNYPPNPSSTTHRLSQVINRARSRSKSRDRRKFTKVVEPETPFLASAPYGTGNTLNMGAPFLNDGSIVVEPDNPFLALRLKSNIPASEEEELLAVMDKNSDTTKPPDSAMTMGSFLSQHKYPPLSNPNFFVQSPARYYHEQLDGDDNDARAILPSQSPKKGHRESWFTTSEELQETQGKKKTLKRSSAVYAGKGGRCYLSTKDSSSMSPRMAGNGYSAGGGRPGSLPLWSKILPGTGPGMLGEVDGAEVYAKRGPEGGFGGVERKRGRERVVEVKREERAGRMDSFSSTVSEEGYVADDQGDKEEWGRSRVVSQHEPEQELVDEFGEREKAALRELLEHVDTILAPTENLRGRSGTRCTGGDWSRERSWWRDVRRSLQ
ncbi:hypothetical protein QBC36DRAFT_357171 [Triangularia setosa]|uniref:Uncharacterized protein n=1 Tax=Triangularia setosa TaxID=2587417 RepID=A0AAN6W6J7_9PEZI|nr:hypothetical protein QBC36DRAFT_357171 [Podospora setosa]